MKALTPKDIALLSTNVPENDHPEWSGITDYAIGDRVISTSTHRIYEAIAASGPSNGGAVDPVADAALAVPTAWADAGATNAHRMLDEYINTQTAPDFGDLVFSVDASACNGVALLNLGGASVTVIHRDSAGVAIATYTKELLAQVDNWLDYFYAPVERLTDTVFLPLLMEYGATLDVTIGGPDAALGAVVVGYVYSIGVTLQGPGVGIIDYSKKSTDSFGRTFLAKGLNATKMDLPCVIDTGLSSDLVLRRLRKLAGTLALWIGDESRDSLVAYGFYSDFSMTIPRGWPGQKDEYTLSIEGVV